MASPTHSDDDVIIGLANPDPDSEQSCTNAVKKVKQVNQKIRRSNSSKDESNKSVELRHGLKQQIDFVKEFVIDGCKAGSQKLPVYAYQDDLLKAVDKHQVLVVIGEAGSGKTTQVPQYLHKGGFTKRGTIACTLPRCGAAISGASKVSHQLGVSLGEEVGYSTRFKDCLSEKTILKYMADEVLLRELIVDDRLASYSVIMIDNAHERSVSSDILIPLIKDILSERPDLKLLISSDTLDVMNFVNYFNCSVFRIDGRKYPVEVHSVKAPESDYLVAAIVAIIQIHVSEPPGDILVFLPDQNDIRRCVGRLNEQCKDTKIASLLICPEPSRKIERTPKGVRKVVFATDIAETSVSNDIKYVIDPGFCRQKVYIPETETESFVMFRITQVLALQRAERVGRDCPGKCFRLYTPHSRLTELSDVTVPEIQRTNLAYTILLLKCIGVHDIVKFDFIDSPPVEAVLKALELLFALSAVNKRGEVTKVGRMMAEFPLDPMMSKMVVASEKYHCSDDIVTIAAMLEFEGSILCPKYKEVHADKLNFGDHIGLLKIYNSWKENNYSQKWCYRNHIRDKTMNEVKIIRDRLALIIEKVGMELTTNNDIDSIKKSIASGYFPHLAKLQKFGSYQTCKHGQTVYIHPASGLAQDLPKLVVYHKVQICGTKDYINVVTEIQPNWLSYISPHYHDIDIEEGRKKDALGKG